MAPAASVSWNRLCSNMHRGEAPMHSTWPRWNFFNGRYVVASGNRGWCRLYLNVIERRNYLETPCRDEIPSSKRESSRNETRWREIEAYKKFVCGNGLYRPPSLIDTALRGNAASQSNKATFAKKFDVKYEQAYVRHLDGLEANAGSFAETRKSAIEIM